MRQRAFMILDPHEIAPVEIAAARLALEKMFGLTNARPPARSPSTVPRGRGSSSGMIVVILHT
jgi:hypothetical protein